MRRNKYKIHKVFLLLQKILNFSAFSKFFICILEFPAFSQLSHCIATLLLQKQFLSLIRNKNVRFSHKILLFPSMFLVISIYLTFWTYFHYDIICYFMNPSHFVKHLELFCPVLNLRIDRFRIIIINIKVLSNITFDRNITI